MEKHGSKSPSSNGGTRRDSEKHSAEDNTCTELRQGDTEVRNEELHNLYY
jgi:hypothetical protein